MGILSGLILSELIIINESKNFSIGSIEINHLSFALLGEFSSELVYKTLSGIIDKILAVFKTNK